MPGQFIEAAKQAALTAKHMPAAVPEVDTMAASLKAQHSADVMNLACMVLLSRNLLQHRAEQSGADLGPLLRLQWDCVRAWTDEKGIALESVEAALNSLERAGKTAHYLSQMPN